MNKKIHGYYTIGNKVFYTKIKALFFASELLNNSKIDKNLITPDKLIKWHFNDEVFDRYDWTKEPEFSLEYLYHKRAKELREKYDYLIVYYSGGCDSHNMLMSFLNQGLNIDELVIHHVNKGIKILDSYNLDAKDAKIQPLTETSLQILPRLKEIKSICPSIKINFFDTTNFTINTFSSKQTGDWILKAREELNPVDSAKYKFTCFDEYKKIIHTNKKIGILVGLDKPSLKIFDNKIYLIFADRRFNINLFYSDIEEYSNAQVEFFYTSPDSCDLICKQAHVMKKWILSSELNKDLFTIKQFLPSYVNANTKLYLEENARTLLYNTTWKKEWFQAKKSILDWHSEADFWFHMLFSSKTLQGSCWIDGIKYAKKYINDYFFYDNDGFKEFTKEYMLENLNGKKNENT
jgi:hypothetical protein